MTKRALISVYYKTGILEFSRELAKEGFEIVSTGGTYSYLKENGIEVKSVESVTGFPEILNGRVKTLHPGVLAGILADKRNEKHTEEMNNLALLHFDVVAVNLYPFTETISKADVKTEEAIEKIDIGGVTLIRAAAKNFKSVCVITEPSDYDEFIKHYRIYNGNIPYKYAVQLALRAFRHVAEYDRAIAEYFQKLNGVGSGVQSPGVQSSGVQSPGVQSSGIQSSGVQSVCGQWSDVIRQASSVIGQELRYGENPHQKAVIYKHNFDELFSILHGKELSYNNILDINAAYYLISEFRDDNPACAIIKHGNPCGTATADDLTEAYRAAFSTDTISPFGGIIIFNKKLDIKTASEADKIFTEIILSPGYDDDALELLKKKKNRRLVSFVFSEPPKELKSVAGGILEQEPDSLVLVREELRTVTIKQPDEKDLDDMIFAYKIVKHTKSNAVVFVKNHRTLGIGAGQPSRIDSTKLAAGKAKEFNISLKNSVVASDAFFPFPDGLIEIAKAGGVYIVQPGGSVRDEEVIRAADENGLCMVFTGYRHFRH
jgi:phosphoribosylaminoimidazolecarboxamide formyltransferase/IMP cyclohydrolase